MSRLTQLLHLDDGEFIAARAAAEAAPLAPRPAPKPLGWGRAMLDFLAAEAPVEPRTPARGTSLAAARALLLVPMRDPSADPLPIEALLDLARHVRRSRDVAFEAVFAEDREASAGRCAAIAAASWTDEAAGNVMAEDCAAVLDAVAARPELRHNTALLMALAPVVAMLKGSVA